MRGKNGRLELVGRRLRFCCDGRGWSLMVGKEVGMLYIYVLNRHINELILVGGIFVRLFVGCEGIR